MQRIPALDITPAQSGEKIHVRLFSGRFQTLRRTISWPLLLAYFGLAWININGQQALLFSFEHRRLYFFGTQWGWYDFPILAGILVISAIALFAASAVVGRIWCGTACPQSVWTWLFLRIEEFTEGPAWTRKRMDEKGLTTEQRLRRISKHALWLLLAAATAITFTGYFVPIRELVPDIVLGEASMATGIWLTTMSALTYLNAGLVREKICLHACPYSRFQSVMFDDNTRTVTYDKTRDSDCIDCSLCVQVCPTGIDIRDGLQAACIDCGACIDACNSVMDKIKKPRGLITYNSVEKLRNGVSPILRTRTLAYAVVISIAVVTLGSFIAQRDSIVVDIERDRQQLYYQTVNDQTCNSYQLEVEYFAAGSHRVDVAIQGLTHAELTGPATLLVPDNGVATQQYQVCVETSALNRTGYRNDIEFVITAGDEQVSRGTTFIAGR